MRRRHASAAAVLMLLAAAAPTTSAAPTASAAPRGALGPRLAYIRDGDLWTVLPTGAGDVQITDSSKDADPTWEPGGSRIAFTRRTASGPEVWVVDTVGGPPTRLVRRASDPSWAPDGSAIAFVRRAKGNTDVWRVAADGSDPRRLTSSPATDTEPAWGPSKIAFVSRRGGRASIWIMAAGGRAERRLTRGAGADRSPAWVIWETHDAVLHEHVEPGGDHDLRVVDPADETLSPILVRDEQDVTPAGAGLVWFAFVRRTATSGSIRTADVDAPLSTMRIIVSTSGLSDPAVPGPSPG
jgi:TolB protein